MLDKVQVRPLACSGMAAARPVPRPAAQASANASASKRCYDDATVGVVTPAVHQGMSTAGKGGMDSSLRHTQAPSIACAAFSFAARSLADMKALTTCSGRG